MLIYNVNMSCIWTSGGLGDQHQGRLERHPVRVRKTIQGAYRGDQLLITGNIVGRARALSRPAGDGEVAAVQEHLRGHRRVFLLLSADALYDARGGLRAAFA